MTISRGIIVLTAVVLQASCTPAPTTSPAPATTSTSTPTSTPPETVPEEDLGPAPEFSAVDANGVLVNNQTIQGKVVVLDFWATWCAPCIMGLPRMQALSDRYKDSPDVEVIAVQVDEVGDAREFFTERKLTLRSIPNSRPMAIAFAASGLPLKVVIGKDGRVKLRSFGSFANDEQRLAELIEALRSTS